MVRGLKTSQPWSWAVLWHGILLGFLLVLSLTGAFNSFGQEPLALDLNRVSLADKVVDSRLEAPELSESGGYRISIRLKGGTLIELQPNLAELNDCCRQHFPDESSQQRFLDKRRMILNNMAAVLSYGKLSLGVGGYIKDRFNQLRNKGESSHPIAEITGERVSGGGQFGPRGLQAISAILHSLDRTLWKQAPLVIEANEFGGLLSLGLIAEGGVRNKGYGGQASIGISIGYNHKEKSFVFDIYRETESFRSSLAAVGVVGITPKLGFFLAQTRTGEAHQARAGFAFYPPGAPGFTQSTSNFFAGGINTALALPPPPFADLMTYTNNVQRTSMLRVAVSPLYKGFLRVSVGGLPGCTQWAWQKIRNLKEEIVYQSRRLAFALGCIGQVVF
ncbi:MAG: hypothetical protein H6624_01570 [Bdellovibrionaceae bacterium]|nr:hypothetical protein [Bdellovibrionales bacterium]MCB9082996.1 hypothetical protein [Pseudobdellovibrionaceae bacterium]